MAAIKVETMCVHGTYEGEGVNEARMSMMDIRAQPMKSQRVERRNSHLVGGLPEDVRNAVLSVGGLRHAIQPR